LSYTRVPYIQAVPPATRRPSRRSSTICRFRLATLGLTSVLWALAFAPAAHPQYRPRTLCVLPAGQASLAPGVRHGLAAHLAQYPELSLALAGERRAAEQLLERLRTATRRWRDVRAARRRGFDTHLAKRAAGDVAIGYLHAEHRRFSADRRYLDPKRPEALIYATAPGRTPVLVGAMFSVPREMRGPTPAGPIARWHAHVVCVGKDDDRGLAPLPNGACPHGARRTQGSEMLHVWFTSDLRSAFAVHAPVPELCRDGLLTRGACRSGASRGGM